ncbi:SCO family protein [Actinomycetospora sp. NBRC 106378]|uniref:SCO family protein n=1 Tax=Actinomycetospora sp. NBRC 106378 TaxID=3032208 RepID=UPI0024A56000|nr:SCO family protein [Actinomycetospora sp. NBRC 106378]GLZ53500.1 photosynthetic protein synthase I [Actinomycetospora sp. NBRC 106378]
MAALMPALVPRYRLLDHHGRAVTQDDFAGSYQLVFFGFTHCRMVCPRELAKLDDVLEALGPLAERVQPLYISVDPERDTPEVMRAFLERHHPRFLGLTGTTQDAEAAREAFHVFARRGVDPEDPEGYAVPHTTLTYLLDANGDYLTHFADVLDAERITARLRELLQ